MLPGRKRTTVAIVADAARALGIAPRTLRQLCAAGRVIGARLIGTGRRAIWLIPVDAATGRPRMRRARMGRPPRWGADPPGGTGRPV